MQSLDSELNIAEKALTLAEWLSVTIPYTQSDYYKIVTNLPLCCH